MEQLQLGRGPLMEATPLDPEQAAHLGHVAHRRVPRFKLPVGKSGLDNWRAHARHAAHFFGGTAVVQQRADGFCGYDVWSNAVGADRAEEALAAEAPTEQAY
jgi:hypothetical protein